MSFFVEVGDNNCCGCKCAAAGSITGGFVDRASGVACLPFAPVNGGRGVGRCAVVEQAEKREAGWVERVAEAAFGKAVAMAKVYGLGSKCRQVLQARREYLAYWDESRNQARGKG